MTRWPRCLLSGKSLLAIYLTSGQCVAVQTVWHKDTPQEGAVFTPWAGLTWRRACEQTRPCSIPGQHGEPLLQKPIGAHTLGGACVCVLINTCSVQRSPEAWFLMRLLLGVGSGSGWYGGGTYCVCWVWAGGSVSMCLRVCIRRNCWEGRGNLAPWENLASLGKCVLTGTAWLRYLWDGEALATDLKTCLMYENLIPVNLNSMLVVKARDRVAPAHSLSFPFPFFLGGSLNVTDGGVVRLLWLGHRRRLFRLNSNMLAYSFYQREMFLFCTRH